MTFEIKEYPSGTMLANAIFSTININNPNWVKKNLIKEEQMQELSKNIFDLLKMNARLSVNTFFWNERKRSLKNFIEFFYGIMQRRNIHFTIIFQEVVIANFDLINKEGIAKQTEFLKAKCQEIKNLRCNEVNLRIREILRYGENETTKQLQRLI